MKADIELKTWQRVAGLAQSVSHDYHHIERVQAYADALGQALGIDTELVRVAAILHDLGRGDETRRHGLSSIEASKEMAEEVLCHLPLSDEQRKVVIEAIEKHDQPDLHPELPAARILKDADFLAGFGAWGILRIAMWSGETGRRIEEVLARLSTGMRRRLDSLEFPESRESAQREFLFAHQFLGELERPARIVAERFKGFYCVIEGISGLGKNTIAQALSKRLAEFGLPHQVVNEPGDVYHKLRNCLPKRPGESVALRKALLMADRAVQFERFVIPSLQKGEVVIGVRSYLSTAVYQTADDAEAYRVMLEHDWVPQSDLLLLLDADTATALARIERRTKPKGEYEAPEYLTAHRAKYQKLARVFPSRHTRILDASRAVADVEEQAFTILKERLELSGFKL
jgi:dTMP kinase